ncbi:hypothetical protein ACFE04_016184 [Oxalis oulophora]
MILTTTTAPPHLQIDLTSSKIESQSNTASSRLSVVAAVKVERDGEIWRVYDTSLKMDDKKKNYEINNEHCKVMEKNTIALQLVREIEDFVQNLSPKQGGALYPGPYGIHQVQGVHGSMPQTPYVIQKIEEHK